MMSVLGMQFEKHVQRISSADFCGLHKWRIRSNEADVSSLRRTMSRNEAPKLQYGFLTVKNSCHGYHSFVFLFLSL